MLCIFFITLNYFNKNYKDKLKSRRVSSAANQVAPPTANHLSNTGNLEVSQQGPATTADGSVNPGANSPEATTEQASTEPSAKSLEAVHSPSASKATGKSPSKSAQWTMTNASKKTKY